MRSAPCSISIITLQGSPARPQKASSDADARRGESCRSRSLAHFYKHPLLYSSYILACVLAGRNFHVWTTLVYDEQDGHADDVACCGPHLEYHDMVKHGNVRRVCSRRRSPRPMQFNANFPFEDLPIAPRGPRSNLESPLAPVTSI